MIIAITTLDFIWNFNSFGLVYVLTEGGPAGKTQLPMLFAYSQAFEYGQFGYASALGSAMVVVIAVVLVFYLWGRLKETKMIVTTRPKRAKSFQYVALGFFLVFLGFPLLWMLSMSFKGPRELVQLYPSFIPEDFTFENYRTALTEDDHQLLRNGINSLKVAIVTALLTTMIGLPAAYVLARRKGLITRLGLGWILLSQMFPLILIIIPLFLLLRDLKLTNSHVGLVLVYVVWALPFILWML